MVQTDSRTPRQQAQWVSTLLAHSGRYGVVTQLSQTIGVARQTLYRWKEKGQAALEAAFTLATAAARDLLSVGTSHLDPAGRGSRQLPRDSVLLAGAPASIRNLFRNTNMQTQYNDLLGALAFVVVGVEQGKDIRKELTTLGAKHHGYGVEAKYYMMVGASLIKTLHEYLADVWTPEVETSWKDAYEVVSSIMMAAPTGFRERKEGYKDVPFFFKRRG